MSYDEIGKRKEALQKIIDLGINPYPSKCKYESLESLFSKINPSEIKGLEDQDRNSKYSISGRIVLFRCMGKNTFITIKDESITMQVMVSRDAIKVKDLEENENYTDYQVVSKLIHIGDFISVTGFIFKTKKGEITLKAEDLSIVCKSLLPLPDKRCGLKDIETIQRKRWLDLISNDESYDKFVTRSKILKCVREFMYENKFMEVETPILQSVYGGANAQPFITKINSLDRNAFLRIALEIPLKEIIVGGMNRVFEIGKVFRNESIDRTHNPEFTSLEAYCAYWDYNDVMSFIENMLERVVLSIHGTTKIMINHPVTNEPTEVDFKAPWKKIDLTSTVSEKIGVDCYKASLEDILECVKDKNIDPDLLKGSKGEVLLNLFEEFCESDLIQPTHVMNYPIESTPLCKKKEGGDHNELTIIERFESYILGIEICNAYSELNDPILQRELMEYASNKDRSTDEYNPVDEVFLESIDQGMPPTGGFGIGIDRIVMFLTNSSKISSVLFFPMMK